MGFEPFQPLHRPSGDVEINNAVQSSSAFGYRTAFSTKTPGRAATTQGGTPAVVRPAQLIFAACPATDHQP
jgi:hypothetical protein